MTIYSSALVKQPLREYYGVFACSTFGSFYFERTQIYSDVNFWQKPQVTFVYFIFAEASCLFNHIL